MHEPEQSRKEFDYNSTAQAEETGFHTRSPRSLLQAATSCVRPNAASFRLNYNHTRGISLQVARLCVARIERRKWLRARLKVIGLGLRVGVPGGSSGFCDCASPVANRKAELTDCRGGKGEHSRIISRSRDAPDALHAASVHVCLLFAVVSLIALLPTSAAAQLTAQQAALIEQGFKVFDTQTFKGNGRTCTTCHLQGADFNISPADIPTLSARQKKKRSSRRTSSRCRRPRPIRKSDDGAESRPFKINDGAGGAATEVEPATLRPVRFARRSRSRGWLQRPRIFCPILPLQLTFLVWSRTAPTWSCSTAPTSCRFPRALQYLLTDVYLDTEPPTFGNVSPGVHYGTAYIPLAGRATARSSIRLLRLTVTPQNQDCVDAVNGSANADPTISPTRWRTFSLAAVKTHFTQSLNRTPGVDFRCPTSDELDAIAAFQEYLAEAPLPARPGSGSARRYR